MAERKQICKRCLQIKYMHGRGLCQTCWKIARSQEFEHYPRRDDVPGLVCRCFSPVREVLPVWGAVQCKRCGKKVL